MNRLTKEFLSAVTIGLVLASLLLIGYALGWSSRPPVRLVGYNCLGASGPIYAAEEDHFPQCLSIEEI